MKNKENKKTKNSINRKKHISLKNRKRYVSFMMVVSLISIFMFFALYLLMPYIDGEIFYYGETIKDNVYVDNKLVSGMTFKELEEYLDNRINSIKETKYELMSEDLGKEYYLQNIDLDFNNKQIINHIKRRNILSLITFKRNYHLNYLNNYKVKQIYNTIEQEFESNPKNGQFIRDENMNVTYEDFKLGYSLKNENLDTILKSIMNGDTLIYVPGKILKPLDYSYIGISYKLSTISLKYNMNINYIKNIENALEKLDGYIIKPDNNLDLYSIIGPISVQNGYRFYNKSVGYGVDLVSSMVYYNSLLSGLSVEERYSPKEYPDYITPGFDASIESGNLIIYNSNKDPIYISTYINGDTVTMDFWSKDTNISYRIVSENGVNLSYNVYRETFKNGKYISRDLINNTIYESY